MDAPRDARTQEPLAPDRLEGVERAHGAEVTRVVTLSLLGLVGLMLGALPYLALLGLVTARWAPLYRLDESVAHGLNEVLASQPLHVRVVEIVSELGGGATAGYALALAVVWLVVRREPRRAAYVAATGLGLAVLVPVSKALVGRTRPEVMVPVVELPTNPSFPSGHAMASLVTWGALTLVALPFVPRRSRRVLVLTTTVIVVVVGFTRLALGVHFVTDVVAGWTLGTLWLTVTYGVFRRWLRVDPTADRHSGSRSAAGMRLAPLDESVLPVGAVSAWRIAGSALAVTAVVAGLGLLVTGPLAPTALHRWDVAVVEDAVVLRSTATSEVVHAVGKLGGLWGVVTATVATCVVGLAHRGSWRPVVFTVLAVVGEVLIYGASSQLVGRARPDVPDLTSGLPTGASFPSGHVAAATAVYGAACLLVLTYARSPWRRAVVLPVAAVVVATMFCRVYVAAHHPTDTAAGALLGVLWLAALHRHLLRSSVQGLTWASDVSTRELPRGRRPPRRGRDSWASR